LPCCQDAVWAAGHTGAKLRNWNLGLWDRYFPWHRLVRQSLAISLTSGGTADLATAPETGWGRPTKSSVRPYINENMYDTKVINNFRSWAFLAFFWLFFVRVIANWFGFVWVTLALVSKSVPGKIMACWLTDHRSQALGMEHIVGEYRSCTPPDLCWVLGVGFAADRLLELSPVTLGNIVGGMVFHRHASLQHGTRSPISNVFAPLKHE